MDYDMIATSTNIRHFFITFICFMLMGVYLIIFYLPNHISQCEYIADTNNELEINIIRGLTEKEWKNHLPTNFISHIPLSKTTFWIKTSFFNDKPREQLWTIGFEYAFLEHLDFYQIVDNEIVSFKKTNIHNNNEQNEYNPLNFTFSQPALKKSDIYIRYKFDGFNIISLIALPKEQYNYIQNLKIFWLAIFFGIVTGLCVYNLFLYFSTLDKIYIYYCGFQGFTLAFHLLFYGLNFR